MVTFEALHEGVVTPARATREAAGYDLRAFLRGRTVRAYRNGTQRARIEHGERIAQVVLARYAALEWRAGSVKRSTDRSGGLGSTG